MAKPWSKAVSLLGLLLAASVAWAQVPKLQPRGYTNDFAGVLSQSAIRRVDTLAGEVEQKTKAQIAVVIVKSLDGQPIEDFLNDLGRRWGVGRKANRGVLLFLAIQDHRDRIEVGYGLEAILPDGKVGGILREMRPYLRQGNYDSAVLQAVNEIAAVIAQDAGVTLEGRLRQRPRQQRDRGVGLPLWVIVFGAIALILVLKTGVNPLFLLWGLSNWGGGSGRGGGSGGNWDGGGFSGFGGGDFGGGGASSDW